MRENGIDCFLITPSSDIKYFCGYSIGGDERLLTLVLAPGHEPFIVANALYKLQVEETPITDFVYWADGEDAFSCLAGALKERDIDIRTIAVDAAMSALFLIGIQGVLKKVKIINGSPLVQPMRVYKDKQELDYMIEASTRAEKSLEAVLSKGTEHLGKTETEFQAEMAFQLTKNGLQGNGGLIAVGQNAAAPHHHAGETKIQNGKCLLVDFGGAYQNYQSDMTRTFHFGKPAQRFRDVYNIVLEANLAGEEAAKAGNRLQDVDRAARAVIDRYGFGEYFIHRTGHGIGIDVHEGPSAGEGETTEIRPGMVFSCEPGIYLPGEFGIRIEDLVAIDLDGSTKILNHMTKKLTVIE